MLLRQVLSLLLAFLVLPQFNPFEPPQQVSNPFSKPTLPLTKAYASVAVWNDRGQSASACPVSGHLALTAKHVAAVGMLGWWDPVTDVTGLLETGALDPKKDLGMVISAQGTFPRSFKIAKEAPKSGEELFVSGFFENQPFGPVPVRALVIYQEELFLEGPSFPGTSGACITNGANELVAIMVGTSALTPFGSSLPLARAVPVWGRK